MIIKKNISQFIIKITPHELYDSIFITIVFELKNITLRLFCVIFLFNIQEKRNEKIYKKNNT